MAIPAISESSSVCSLHVEPLFCRIARARAWVVLEISSHLNSNTTKKIFTFVFAFFDLGLFIEGILEREASSLLGKKIVAMGAWLFPKMVNWKHCEKNVISYSNNVDNMMAADLFARGEGLIENYASYRLLCRLVYIYSASLDTTADSFERTYTAYDATYGEENSNYLDAYFSSNALGRIIKKSEDHIKEGLNDWAEANLTDPALKNELKSFSLKDIVSLEKISKLQIKTLRLIAKTENAPLVFHISAFPGMEYKKYLKDLIKKSCTDFYQDEQLAAALAAEGASNPVQDGRDKIESFDEAIFIPILNRMQYLEIQDLSSVFCPISKRRQLLIEVKEKFQQLSELEKFVLENKLFHLSNYDIAKAGLTQEQQEKIKILFEQIGKLSGQILQGNILKYKVLHLGCYNLSSIKSETTENNYFQDALNEAISAL